MFTVVLMFTAPSPNGRTYAQILSHLSTLISVMFSILSCSPVCHVLAGDNTHPHNTTDKREHSQFNYTMNSNLEDTQLNPE